VLSVEVVCCLQVIKSYILNQVSHSSVEFPRDSDDAAKPITTRHADTDLNPQYDVLGYTHRILPSLRRCGYIAV
jgi:hypothetical protein